MWGGVVGGGGGRGGGRWWWAGGWVVVGAGVGVGGGGGRGGGGGGVGWWWGGGWWGGGVCVCVWGGAWWTHLAHGLSGIWVTVVFGGLCVPMLAFHTICSNCPLSLIIKTPILEFPKLVVSWIMHNKLVNIIDQLDKRFMAWNIRECPILKLLVISSSVAQVGGSNLKPQPRWYLRN